ncbi:hypothetical protein ABIE78_001978 [Sinorhizobium fredii]|uniref:Uncharacterized protein n=1 Tax=Sinorhizobium fredii (strain USDA 257) TaxID=1185652 RepID=I3X8F5_SINF2|nr:hypothetical protein [Sinorhizobium fredii]AFL52161.1 hypothetical protein USDA257_c36040 [Sinorhizobium fredii USDA 257]
MTYHAIRREALALCREEIERRVKFYARCDRMGVSTVRVYTAADMFNRPFFYKPWQRKHREFAKRVAPYLTFEQWDNIAYECDDLARRMHGPMDGIRWFENIFEPLRLKDGRMIVA